jgi:glycosyltransferase involved in cell wall biosynthesis
VRVLLVNEGTQGVAVQGHRMVGTRLQRALACAQGDVELRLCELGPMSGGAVLAVRDVPGARRWDLDLQPTRWQLVQALRARRVITRELAAWPPDVLYIHSHALAIGAADQLERVPTVLSVDAPLWAWRTMAPERRVMPYSRAALAPSLGLERRVLRAAITVQAWSEWARSNIVSASPSAQVAVVHPGIDTRRYQPAPRTAAGRPRILFVGGRFEEKGGQLLLDVLRPALGQTVDLDLVTPADVPTRPGVRLHRLRSEDPELVELFQQATLLCLPTRQDASPWAVLEAMACGTPVVASRLAGIPEMIGDTGVLVAPGDGPELALALNGLLADPNRRTRLGAGARARCLERFDSRRQASALRELLRAAADTPRRGPRHAHRTRRRAQ